MRMRVQCQCSHKQVNIHCGVINPPGLMPRINWKADTDVMSVRLGVRQMNLLNCGRSVIRGSEFHYHYYARPFLSELISHSGLFQPFLSYPVRPQCQKNKTI